MNQFNALHGDEPTDIPRELNIQPPSAHFKSSTSPHKTSPVVPSILGILTHHSIDNGDFWVHPSYFPAVYNSVSVTDPDIDPIKSIDDD